MTQQLNLLFTAIVMMASTMGMNKVEQETASKVMDRQEHKVIFQVSQADSAQQLVVAGQVNNILKSLPNAKIEVVAHSKGLALLLSSQSKVAAQVEALIGKGVIFAACENTMEKMKVTKADLLPGVTTVPSAMAEIILKQEAGWTYVKAGL